ncbi:MAG: DUF3127 domain-containing protein [Muribaculaceae bacterium]
MEITGKIIVKLPLASGTSKAGNEWHKQEYVLETLESFPKKVHFDFFGDKADQYPLNIGDVIRLSFDIESREYNGRWYTSIRGWKAEAASAQTTAAAAAPAPQIAATPVAPAANPIDMGFAATAEETDDLPF